MTLCEGFALGKDSIGSTNYGYRAVLGRPFIGLVLGNYHQRNITLSDVAGYLGVRVKHVETIERRMVV